MDLRSGGLSLPVQGGLATAVDPALTPLVAAVNGIATGSDADLELAILTGTDVRGELAARPAGEGVVLLARGGRSIEVSIEVLRDLADQLTRLVAGEPPWLFARPAGARRPHPWAQGALTELEAEARLLDGLPESATASAKRRFLLIELEAAGLLDDELAEDKRRWLRYWQLPTLIGYLEAAKEAWQYYRGELRVTTTGDAPIPASLVGATVSIDWFRKYDATPAGWRKHWWIGVHEASWLRELAARPEKVASGSWFSKFGETSAVMYWRTDDGVHPSLLRADFKE